MNEAGVEIVDDPQLQKVIKGKIGVYCIRNTVNGKRYIGSASRCMRIRWIVHRSALNNGKHHSPVLQRAWVKYGSGAFQFVILDECAPEDCVTREQHFINLWKSHDKRFGYNISPTAGSSFGVKMREESKKKMRDAKRGKKLTAEHINKVRDSLRGREFTPEHRAKLSAALMGIKRNSPSEETRKRISEGTKMGLICPMARARKSQATKARYDKPGERAKASLIFKEIWSRPGVMAKSVAARTGRKRSMESRGLMSAAAKLREARKRVSRVLASIQP